MLDYQVWRVYVPGRDTSSTSAVNAECELRSSGPVTGPFEFTRSEAGRLCAEFNRYYGQDRAYQYFELRRADGKSLDWRDREMRRFALREYDEVPWHCEPWYRAKHNEHFCHISVKQPGMVAYTMSEQHGEADRQTATRPGRYLTKHFSDVLSNEQIEQWVAKLSVQLEENALHITQDADEIETIYVNGPSSCMSYEPSYFQGHCHPTRVYAGPDLGLAYIGPVDGASGRCVVWPDRKQYGRIYGDVSRMTLLLQAAGYEEGSFRGARLRRIVDENGNGLIVPYMDGFGCADDGTHLVVGGAGAYVPSGQTEGVSEDNSFQCGRCGDGCNEEETSEVRVDSYGSTQSWCPSCSSNLSAPCEYDGERYSDQYFSFSEVYNLHYNTILRRNVVMSRTVCDDNLDADGAVYVEDRGEYWASSCTFFCEETQQTWHTDDAYTWDGDPISHQGAEQRMADAHEDEAHDSHVRAHLARSYGEHLAIAA